MKETDGRLAVEWVLEMTKNPKSESGEPVDKWSVPTLSYEQMMGISRLVKQEKLKVDYVKTGKKDDE